MALRGSRGGQEGVKRGSSRSVASLSPGRPPPFCRCDGADAHNDSHADSHDDSHGDSHAHSHTHTHLHTDPHVASLTRSLASIERTRRFAS
eukprot:55522-Prorocentrum_minimum.AAC.1